MDVFFKIKKCTPHLLIRQAIDIVFQYPNSLLAIPQNSLIVLEANSCPAARLLYILYKEYFHAEILATPSKDSDQNKLEKILANKCQDYSFEGDTVVLCKSASHAEEEIRRTISKYCNWRDRISHPGDYEKSPEKIKDARGNWQLKGKTQRNEGPSPAARLRVLNRDRYTCVYCGRHGSEAELHVDHIQPVANGGSHHISNLQTTCRHCNQSKGKRKAPKTRPETIESSDAEYSKSSVGLWVLTFEPLKEHQKNIPIHRDIRWQGLIIGKEDDFFLVQLYSWWGGSPTHVVALKKSFVFDADQAVMFAEKEDLEEFIEGNKQVKKQTNREAL